MATEMKKQAKVEKTAELKKEFKKIGKQYKTLKDQEFTGVYLGTWSEQGKTWYMIEPAAKDPVRDKLAAIQHFVQGKVWKGFTTDQDRKYGPQWNDRFFVDLNFAGIPSPDKFKINGYEPFKLTTPNALYALGVGIALKVTAIPFFTPTIV